MKKSKSRAIRRRSARQKRGGAGGNDMMIPTPTNCNKIAPEILKPLILAAVFSSIMRQKQHIDSTAMFVHIILPIIAHHLTVEKIDRIFPDASTTEIKSMIVMLNGGRVRTATPPVEVDGGSRRRNKYRLRSKTHKQHQIQYGGNKKLIFMVLFFISACFFIYMGITEIASSGANVSIAPFTDAYDLFQRQHTFPGPSHPPPPSAPQSVHVTAAAHMDYTNTMDDMNGMVLDLHKEVMETVSMNNPPGLTQALSLQNLQNYYDGVFAQMYKSTRIQSILNKITLSLTKLVTSATIASSASDVGRGLTPAQILALNSTPFVTILQNIITDTLPKEIVTQIHSSRIVAVIELIIGSGLGLVFGRSLLFRFRDNDDDDDDDDDSSQQLLLHGPREGEDHSPRTTPKPRAASPPLTINMKRRNVRPNFSEQKAFADVNRRLEVEAAGRHAQQLEAQAFLREDSHNYPVEAPVRNADPYNLTQEGFAFFAGDRQSKPVWGYNINGRSTHEPDSNGNEMIIHNSRNPDKHNYGLFQQFKKSLRGDDDMRGTTGEQGTRSETQPSRVRVASPVSVYDQQKKVPPSLRQGWLTNLWRQQKGKEKGK